MIRPTGNSICIMSLMVNANVNKYWATRHDIVEHCKNVKKKYTDVLLKRMLDDGLITRRKIRPFRRTVWGYRATKPGIEWWNKGSPSVRGIPSKSTQLEIAFVPIEETIEREGWVERWNRQVVLLPIWAAKRIRLHMKEGRNYKKDHAKQKIYDCPAFHAVTTASERTGHTLRLKFRLEPWRDYLAEWFGYCGLSDEETIILIGEIEQQLPDSFKQQEHRVIGRFGAAVRAVEGRAKITTTDLKTGERMIRTEIEHSRKGDLQAGGDGQIVDTMIGILSGMQTEECIRIARERGEEKKQEEENKRLRQAIVLLAKGKLKEAVRLLGEDIDIEELDEKWKDAFA